MRYISRQPLSAAALRFLKKRTEKVLSATDSKAEARRLWRLQRNKTFAEIRATLREMAAGRERCMYTSDSEGTDIDHFWPQARYPEKAFTWENYLLAASRCNSNDKRDEFPLDESGEPLLLNPTVDDPQEHLDLVPANGRYAHRTRRGAESLRVYDLNRSLLARGRRSSWTVIEACLILYAEARQRHDATMATRCEEAVREQPFPGVLEAFLRVADGTVTDGVDARCLEVLERYPEVRAWT
jgi:hypothetical protein